jgi:hypothetical protein
MKQLGLQLGMINNILAFKGGAIQSNHPQFVDL